MDSEEATLKRAMVACSSRVIVAATTEKLVPAATGRSPASTRSTTWC
jgi:DeoR/GlpR family transcriptional regulator of sugar metabolism